MQGWFRGQGRQGGIRPDSDLTGGAGVWGRRRFTSTSPDLRWWTDGGEIALFEKDVQFILVDIRDREQESEKKRLIKNCMVKKPQNKTGGWRASLFYEQIESYFPLIFHHSCSTNRYQIYYNRQLGNTISAELLLWILNMKRSINEPVSDQLLMVFTITNLFIGWQSTKKTLKRQLAPLRLVKGQCASGSEC